MEYPLHSLRYSPTVRSGLLEMAMAEPAPITLNSMDADFTGPSRCLGTRGAGERG